MVQDPKWVKVGHRYAVGYVRPSFGRTIFKLWLALSGLGFRLKHSSRYKILQLMVQTHGTGLPPPAQLDFLVCYSMSLWVSLIYESTVQCACSSAFMISLGNLVWPAFTQGQYQLFQIPAPKVTQLWCLHPRSEKTSCYALTLAMSEESGVLGSQESGTSQEFLSVRNNYNMPTLATVWKSCFK